MLSVLFVGGFGLLGLPRCAPPGEDGPGTGDAPSAAPRDGEPEAVSGGRPNLLVVLVDTLRADAVHPLDGAEPAMPFLASLAAKGVSFSEASASSSWTMPSATSLLTGLLPSDHGLLDSRLLPTLPMGVTTFAEVLHEKYGYETAAFANGPWLRGPAANLQGFEVQESSFSLQDTRAALDRWLARRDPSRPFFLFLHTCDAHEPYGAANHPWPAPPPVPVRRPDARGELPGLEESLRACLTDRATRDRYAAAFGARFMNRCALAMSQAGEGTVAGAMAPEFHRAYREGLGWVDGLLQDSVRAFRDAGLLDNTLLCVVGDHGEGFGEHGMLGHGRQLYDELVRVPMVLVGPGPLQGGKQVGASVGIVDAIPTFFELAGLPLPEGIEGRSLLPVVKEDGPGWPVLAEEILSERNTGTATEAYRASVRTTRWKYVITYDSLAGTVVEELYDLAADPEERENQLDERGLSRTALDEATCNAISRVRERVSLRSTVDREKAGTPYGAQTSGIDGLEPGPCASVRPGS